MNKDDALKALAQANVALSKVKGLRYWLDCGSLLGAIREGTIMAHDLDVDFSCNDWKRHKEINKAMISAGFKPFRTHGRPNHGYEQRFVHRTKVRVDIFYFYPGTVRDGERVDDPNLCWQGSYDGSKLLVSEFPSDFISETIQFTFEGITVPVPKDPERLLQARYGDWRTPQTKWDWRTDPKCLVRHKPTGLEDVTFLIKTFMRYKLALRAVKSIRNFHGDVPVIVVDDSSAPESFARELEARNVELVRLPYDSGLSAGRNEGIKKVKTGRVILLDDDMVVTHRSRLKEMLTLLDHADVVCGAMRQNGKIIEWEGTYEFPEGGMRLVPFNGTLETADGIEYGRVDFGLNILASRPEFLNAHPWDDELKIVEHTDFFVRLKRAGATVLLAPNSIVDHKPERDPKYREFRRRKEFRLRFMHKHGLKFHIGYKGHRDEWTLQDQRDLDALLAKEAA